MWRWWEGRIWWSWGSCRDRVPRHRLNIKLLSVLPDWFDQTDGIKSFLDWLSFTQRLVSFQPWKMIIKYKVFYSRTIIITTSTIHKKWLAMTFYNLQRIDLNILLSIVSSMFHVNIFRMAAIRTPRQWRKVNLGNFIVLSTDTPSVTHLIGRKTLCWKVTVLRKCVCVYSCRLADFRLFV